jgi:hypothetical protein
MDFFSEIAGGISWIANWLNGDEGIYAFFEELLQEAVAWMVIAKLEFMLWSMKFSWGVAKEIIFNLGIGDYISNGFGRLDPMLMGYVNFFKIPEAVNMLVQAYITRLTLRVMGW